MKIYVGDEGTVFKVTVGNDLTDATVTKMKVKKPDATEIEWTAEILDPASDGIITYVIEAGDLDQAGTWQLQSYIESASGKWSGDTVSFIVYDEYK